VNGRRQEKTVQRAWKLIPGQPNGRTTDQARQTAPPQPSSLRNLPAVRRHPTSVQRDLDARPPSAKIRTHRPTELKPIV